MSDLLRKHLHGVIKQIDRTKREITALLTHQVVDADGEIVVAGGVKWDRFRHNAPMFADHDRQKRAGNWLAESLRLVTVDGAPGWMATGRLYSSGHAVADHAYRELQEGDMGVSIGFRPIRMDYEKVAPGQTGRTYHEVEIVEASLTALQSCPTCTVVAKCARDGEAVLRLADEDDVVLRLLVRDDEAEDRITFDDRDLVVAVRTVVEDRVQAAVRRQTRDLFGLAPAAPVLRIEDARGDVYEVDADTLKAAISTMLERTVAPKVHAAICALTGRVD